MLYETLFSRLEKVRWNMESDIAWDTINPAALTPYQIETIRNICKTETGSLFATEAFIRDFYDDIDFSSFISVWYYEEMKHCLVLKKYLSHVGVEISEEELQQLRMTIPPGDKETILMIHFLSEHRLAMWYRGIARWLEDQVGRDIFNHLANDELRHAQSYFQYIRKDLAANPGNLLRYLRAAILIMSPKAPADIHAVTLTKTTDRLPDPRYIKSLDETVASQEAKDLTNRRLYSLLSVLSERKIHDYKELSSLVKELKKVV